MQGNSFRTEISIARGKSISLKDRILTTGSCFAQQFGDWLASNKFNVLSNPFGTTYNPISIHENLADSLANKLNESLFFEADAMWKHFNYHSHWWASDKQSLTNTLQAQQNRVCQYLKESQVIIITYGTAWVYTHKTETCIVSNCHKAPATLFEKRLLTVAEIVKSFTSVYEKLQGINPGVRIILTVSPVRHLKDTIVLNSVSKATLRIACHQLVGTHEHVDYFPSYEIMMDDLRDYRFYDRDRIHPTEEAFEYISQKFSEQYFPAEVTSFIENWESLKQALQHKPFHPDSMQHQLFLKDLLTKLKSFSEINVEEEIRLIQSQIHPNA